MAVDKRSETAGKIHYIRTTVKIGLLLLCCMGVTHLLLLTGTISSYFGNLANAYKQYGFAYCFTCSVVDRGISKSDEYTPEYVNSLKEDIEEIEVENSENHRISFFAAGVFFDPNLVKGISFRKIRFRILNSLWQIIRQATYLCRALVREQPIRNLKCRPA